MRRLSNQLICFLNHVFFLKDDAYLLIDVSPMLVSYFYKRNRLACLHASTYNVVRT